MASHAFCLRLRLHTPVILPRVAPRLDVLLAEATRCLRLDWDTNVTCEDIPLDWDVSLEGLKGSQLVFGTTRRHGLVATSAPFSTAVTQLPYRQASPPIRKRIKLDGGTTAPRLSEHPALLAPYALFYGVGDGDRCAALLMLLTGLGCEHASGWGEFTVEDVVHMPSEDRRWHQRPWAADRGHAHAGLPYQPVVDQLATVPGGADVPVLRPPRILKEFLDA